MIVKCKELMTREPDSCTPDATVQQVGAMMGGRDLNVLPVVQGGKLVGIVTDRDLTVNVLGNASATDQTTIGEIMSTPPISCWEDEEVEVALALMKQHNITRLPVVNEHALLVGLISLADIADALQDEALSRRVIHEISRPIQKPS